MPMTIKEIADKQHITKAAVYIRMHEINNFKIKYSKMMHGKRIINNKGVRLLLRRGRNHSSNINTSHNNNINIITLLKKETKEKDTQIHNLNKSNKDLRMLLNQQQQLQLSSQQEVKRLKSHIKKINGPIQQHGFLWRLFH